VAVEEVIQAGRYVFYRDHADPHKYYYVPGEPRLATKRDGTPEFSFIKYTKTDSTTKGGVLHFLVTWGFTSGELSSAESALKGIDPQAKLAGPVPFKEATFQVISATAGKDGIFNRRIVGEGKAPVLPGQKAAVSIALTEEGASLLWESFKNPTSDVSVQYVLKFSGITPAFQAKLKVDWDKVYTQHDIKAAVEGTVKVVKLRADLGATLEELRQKGAIQLEVVGENENMQKLLETAYNHILQLMCDKVPTGTGTAAPATHSYLWLRKINELKYSWSEGLASDFSKLDISFIDLSSSAREAGGPRISFFEQSQGQQPICDSQSLERSNNHARTALALYRVQKYDQAIHYYELAYEACPRPTFLFSIGWIQAYKLLNTNSAVEKFQQFLEKSAGYPGLTGLRQDAQDYLNLYRDAHAALVEIRSLHEQGKYYEALALIRDYSERIPNPLWQFNAALCYTDLGEKTNDVLQLAKARAVLNEAFNRMMVREDEYQELRLDCEALSERIEASIKRIQAATGQPGQMQQADQATATRAEQTGAVRSSEEEARRARRQQAQSGGQSTGQQAQQAQVEGATATGAQQQATTGAERATTGTQAGDVRGALGQQATSSGQTSGTQQAASGQTTTGATGAQATTPPASTSAQSGKPAQATTPAAPEVKPIVSVQLGYSFKRTKLSGKYEVDMRRRLREDREIVMSGNISGIYQKYGEDKRFFTVVSLDDPAFQERTVEVILDGQDAEDFKNYVNSVSVIFRKQRMGGAVQTGEVKFFEQQFAEKGNRLSYKYSRVNEASTEWLNYEYRTKWALYGGVEWESDWVKTDDSVLTLTPPVRRRTIEISVDEDNILQNKIKAVAVQVKHNVFGKDVLKEVVINYDKGDPLVVNYTYMHEEGKPGYSYRVIWLTLDGREVETPWVNREGPFIYAVFNK
jgi:tetratricopeptide (TPR) repeat protein